MMRRRQFIAVLGSAAAAAAMAGKRSVHVLALRVNRRTVPPSLRARSR